MLPLRRYFILLQTLTAKSHQIPIALFFSLPPCIIIVKSVDLCEYWLIAIGMLFAYLLYGISIYPYQVNLYQIKPQFGYQ
jgi:hypothetical protein